VFPATIKAPSAYGRPAQPPLGSSRRHPFFGRWSLSRVFLAVKKGGGGLEIRLTGSAPAVTSGTVADAFRQRLGHRAAGEWPRAFPRRFGAEGADGPKSRRSPLDVRRRAAISGPLASECPAVTQGWPL